MKLMIKGNSAKKNIVITGGAGFIGVNLINFLNTTNNIVVIDNFSLGSRNNIEKYTNLKPSNIIEADLSNSDSASYSFSKAAEILEQVDELWHLAANSDIPSGVENPSIDLKDTFLTTFYSLKECKKFNIKKFNFASSSAVYGDWPGVRLQESLGPFKPISNYGAMKLAAEAQICASAESFLDEVNIFRFSNIVGTPATHGVILDFFKKLESNPERLDVLGDGSQKKNYLHVSELINAMIHISNLDMQQQKIRIINLGSNDEGILVSDIAKIVIKIASPKAKIIYGIGNKGWVGDIPRFSFDTSILNNLGWEAKMSSYYAVLRAAQEIYQDEKSKN
jgi:UDP-glucose 4-epimerase